MRVITIIRGSEIVKQEVVIDTVRANRRFLHHIEGYENQNYELTERTESWAKLTHFQDPALDVQIYILAHHLSI